MTQMETHTALLTRNSYKTKRYYNNISRNAIFKSNTRHQLREQLHHKVPIQHDSLWEYEKAPSGTKIGTATTIRKEPSVSMEQPENQRNHVDVPANSVDKKKDKELIDKVLVPVCNEGQPENQSSSGKRQNYPDSAIVVENINTANGCPQMKTIGDHMMIGDFHAPESEKTNIFDKTKFLGIEWATVRETAKQNEKVTETSAERHNYCIDSTLGEVQSTASNETLVLNRSESIEQNNNTFLTRTSDIEVIEYGCEDCGCFFKLYDTFKRHRHYIHNIPIQDVNLLEEPSGYNCRVCGFFCKTFNSLKYHKHYKHNMPPYGDLSVEFARHKDIQPTSSDTPLDVNRNEALEQKHKRCSTRVLDNADPRFICDFCGSICKSCASLESHIYFTHNIPLRGDYSLAEARRYYCSICGRFYKTYVDLKSHRQSNHNLHIQDDNSEKQAKIYYCSICGCFYKTYKSLQCHMQLKHSSEKQAKIYYCSICGCFYKTYKNFQCHMQLKHTDSMQDDNSLGEDEIINMKSNEPKPIDFDPMEVSDNAILNRQSDTMSDVKTGDGSTQFSLLREGVYCNEATCITGGYKNDIGDKDHNTSESQAPSSLKPPVHPDKPHVNESIDDNSSTIQSLSKDGDVITEHHIDDFHMLDDMDVKEEHQTPAISINARCVAAEDLNMLNAYEEQFAIKNVEENINCLTEPSVAMIGNTICQLIDEEHNYCLRDRPSESAQGGAP